MTTTADGVRTTSALNAIGVSSADGVNAGTAQSGIGVAVGSTKLALSTRRTSMSPMRHEFARSGASSR